MSDRRTLSSSLSADVIEYACRRGHSQAEIARMLHVSEGFISLVKSRERSLTIDHLELLTDGLSMPLGALLIAVNEPPPGWKGSPEAKKAFDRLAAILRKGDEAKAAILHGAGTK